MSENLDPLILDFLEWLAPNPRPYAEVMEAWRTSCPRLTVWEDSLDRGFVARVSANGASRVIALTGAGRDFLADHRRMAPSGVRAAPSREESRDEKREGRRR
jgi:hypothetical protein